MTKILHVYKNYYPEFFGGVQKAIHDISESSYEYGFHSTVFSLSQNPSNEIFEVGNHKAFTVREDFNISSSAFSFSAFKPFFKLEHESDIIHYHFPWPFMDILRLISRVNKPIIVTYHSDIIKQRVQLKLYKPLMYNFLNGAQKIIATSPNYLKSSPILKYYQNKTDVIALGIPIDRKLPNPSVVEKWKTRIGEGFFLFCGALRYYKGLHVLLEAAACTKLSVVIAGTGDQEEYLKRIAPENVKFIGHYSDEDREALFSLAKAFVFPSHLRSEAFGISLLEAARAGLPLITCEIGTGTSYVNRDGATGIVVPPNDSETLATAMQLMSTSPDMVARLGHGARTRFENMFTSRQMGALYAEQYAALLRK